MAMKGFTVSPSICNERCNVGQFRAPQNGFRSQLLDYECWDSDHKLRNCDAMVDYRDHIFRWSEHLDLESIMNSSEYVIQFTHSCSLWPKFRKSLGSWPNQRRLSRIWRTGNGTCRTTVHPKMAQLKRMLRRLKNEAKIRERGSKLPVGDINKKVQWRGLGKGWKGMKRLCIFNIDF